MICRLISISTSHSQLLFHNQNLKVRSPQLCWIKTTANRALWARKKLHRPLPLLKQLGEHLRAKPLRAYQDPSRIPTYSRSFRIQESTTSVPFPDYSFTSIQQSRYRRLVRITSEIGIPEEFIKNLWKTSKDRDSADDASQIETSDEDEFSINENTRIQARNSRKIAPLSRLEKALLHFSIALLDQSTSEDEYELPFVDALAVLGLDHRGSKGVDSYPSILSYILKIGCFLVLRLAFENSSSIESRLDDSSSVSSTNSTMEERFSGSGAQNGPLLRLETLVNRFLVRGCR